MILLDSSIKKTKSIDGILEKFAYKHPYLFFYLIFVVMPMCVLIVVTMGACIILVFFD